MPAAGDRFGAYELIEKLGEGGFGEVWKAADPARPDVLVCVKVPTREEGVRALRREGRLQQALSHPGIVRVLECAADATPPYLVTEYVPGESLRARLTRERRLALPDAARVLLGLLAALETAHDAGLVHRDLKPENVLLCPDGQVKLADFGLGQAIRDAASLQLSGKPSIAGVAGTLDYMAPEQRAGEESDERTDLHACGVILYEMLTGNAHPVVLPVRGAPPAVTALIQRALARAPRSRWQTSPLMAAALTAAVFRPRPWRRGPLGFPWPGELAVFVTLALAGFFAYHWARQDGQGRPRPAPAHEASFGALEGAGKAPVRPRTARRDVPGFTYLGDETFQCGTQRQQVAIYRCEAFARELGLLHDQTHVATEFVLVPAGSFQMGAVSGGEDNERPVRQVSVPPFLLGRTEVTQAIWDRYISRQGLPAMVDRRQWQGLLLPIDGVSWNHARSLLHSARLRLPSEAEWEYACRAGSTGKYCFGDSEAELSEYAHHQATQTRRVASGRPNAFGLFDMHGNVAEWCEDVYDGDYRDAPNDGSARETPWQLLRVRRGGGWLGQASFCRSASRGGDSPGEQRPTLGFRAARSLP